MNTHSKQTSPEDVDLLLLLERTIRFFRKYGWVFLLAGIMGLATGYYFYRSVPITYKSRMIVHSYFLTNQEEIEIVRNWNRLLGRGEYQVLAATLNCDPAILPKVKSIKAQEIQQVFTPDNPHGFVIDVVVTENKVLDELQQGLVKGFENTAYMNERLRVKRAGLEQLINRTASEMRFLDSMKQSIMRLVTANPPINSPLIIDGTGVNAQLVTMQEKLLAQQEELKFLSAVQVLQPLEKFRKPAGPHLFPWLVMGLVAFLSLAYVICLIHAIRARMNLRAAAAGKPLESADLLPAT